MASETALVFFAYAFVGLVVLFFALRLGCKRRDLPGFVCTPISCFTLLFENIAIACEFLADNREDVETLLSVRFVIHSLVVPLFIITCFELGYQVHKKRGVNYCCIRFEEGHRKQNDLLAQLLRFFPWVLAIAVCIVSLIANADHIKDPIGHDAPRFSNEELGFRDTDGLSGFMDFLPSLILVFIAVYAGGSLWKYGTYYAMEVHATTVNPWVFLFASAIFALVAGLVTPSDWAGPYLTNAAELVLASAVVHATFQVDMNLEEIREFGGDLKVTNQMSKVIQSHNRRSNMGGTPASAPVVGRSDVEAGGATGSARRVRRGAGPGKRRVSRAGMAAVTAAATAKRRAAQRRAGRRGDGVAGHGRGARRPPSQRDMADEEGDGHVSPPQNADDVYGVGSDEEAPSRARGSNSNNNNRRPRKARSARHTNGGGGSPGRTRGARSSPRTPRTPRTPSNGRQRSRRQRRRPETPVVDDDDIQVDVYVDSGGKDYGEN